MHPDILEVFVDASSAGVNRHIDDPQRDRCNCTQLLACSRLGLKFHCHDTQRAADLKRSCPRLQTRAAGGCEKIDRQVNRDRNLAWRKRSRRSGSGGMVCKP